MNDLARQKLTEIVAIYGETLYENDRRTEGLLRDYCGECKREIHVLVTAVQEKVPTDLLSSQHSLPREVLLPRLSRRLVENRALEEAAAQWAVESWALALGIISNAECSVAASGGHVQTGSGKATATPSISSPKSPAIPLSSLDTPSLITEPTPYTLRPGLIITSFEELPDACEQAWDQAVDHFVRGYFTEWVERWLVSLRAKGRYDYVAGLEPLVREVRSTLGEVARGDRIVRSAALEDFLLTIGRISGKPNAPKLALMEDGVDLGVVEQGAISLGRFILTNKTRGFLHGEIVSRAPNLTIEPSRFGCRCNERLEVEVKVDTASLKGSPQGKRFYSVIEITSNGGRKEVKVGIKVGIPALDVEPTTLDFGRIVIGKSSSQMIQIANSGIGELFGELQATDAWLKSDRGGFRCPSGKATRKEVKADTSGLALGHHKADLTISANVGSKLVTCAVVVVKQPKLEISPARLLFDLTSIERSLKLANVGGGTLRISLCVPPWLTVDAAALELNENRSAEITVRADFGVLGSQIRESSIVVAGESNQETVQVVADGQSIPPQRSSLGWELKSPDGSSLHTRNKTELRELVTKGYWINNDLPPRPIADLALGESLYGIVKQRMAAGAIVDIGAEVDGLLHVSQFRIAEGKTLVSAVQEGDGIIVQITGKKQGYVGLTMIESA